MADGGLPVAVAERPLAGRGRGGLLNTLFLYAVVGVAVFPIAYLVFASFNIAPPGSPFRFGLDAWDGLFDSPSVARAIRLSFTLSLRTFIAFAIAFTLAWALARLPIAGRRFIETSLWFAFFLPAVPVATAWVLLLHENYGLINKAIALIPGMPQHVFSIQSIPGIMWVYISVSTVPFLTITLGPAIRQMDATFEEAARVAGATGGVTARRVTLPMLMPAIVVSVMAIYIKSLESFEVEQLIGTPVRLFVFTTKIYDLVRQSPPQITAAMALGSLFLTVTGALAFLQVLYMRRRPPPVTVRAQSFRSQHAARKGLLRLASAAILLYFAVTLYLPVATLAVGSFNKIFGFFQIADPWTLEHWQKIVSDGRFLRAARNSALLGVGVSLIALPIYFRMAWILSRTKVRGRFAATLLLWLPWAVPGFLFGLALLDLMLRNDLFGPLYGTFAPVIIALLIRELPIGVHLLKTGLDQIGTDLEEAACVYGARPFTIFRRVTLPLVSGTIGAVAVVIFAAAVREISTIVLVAGPGTETMSLLMFDYASSGHAEQAAVIGVLFAGLAMLLALGVNRRILPAGLR
ncbi:MAG: ABC transporter permease subunit [Bauldia sp.]